LNHLTLAVSDVARSVSFYQRVLGMRTQFTQATEADWKKPIIPVLGIGGGPQFLAFSAARQGGGRIDHFCLGMERFNADRVVKILAEHGIKANVRKRADSDPPSEELTFADPDNIRVQIQDVTYCGGKGVLGNDCKDR
jgi:catechol 2,3-dioxygenase-like lactoylglutathione lyase family enzyme